MGVILSRMHIIELLIYYHTRVTSTMCYLICIYSDMYLKYEIQLKIQPTLFSNENGFGLSFLI